MPVVGSEKVVNRSGTAMGAVQKLSTGTGDNCG